MSNMPDVTRFRRPPAILPPMIRQAESTPSIKKSAGRPKLAVQQSFIKPDPLPSEQANGDIARYLNSFLFNDRSLEITAQSSQTIQLWLPAEYSWEIPLGRTRFQLQCDESTQIQNDRHYPRTIFYWWRQKGRQHFSPLTNTGIERIIVIETRSWINESRFQ